MNNGVLGWIITQGLGGPAAGSAEQTYMLDEGWPQYLDSEEEPS